jgi:GNAT superfamily N-acetyltransferase
MRYDQPGQWQHLPHVGVPCLSPESYRRDQAEAHLVWLDANGCIVARCSLWWSQTPRLEGGRVGAIGHYAAADRAAGVSLLEAACDALARAGSDIAVAPMDGNTWRSYRLIVDRGTEPAFCLEPSHPEGCLADFETARFHRFAEYCSTVCDDLTVCDPRAMRADRRLAKRGVTVRPLAMDQIDRDLRAMYEVSVEAFAHALLYQSVSRETMKAMYQPLLQRIDPALVLLAERDGEVVGFAFGLPDECQAARGEPIDTAILKTLAVRPGRAFAGLGAVLMQRFHDTARRRGMRRVIHALMHEQNHRILALSARYARTMRRYALLARKL